MARRLQIALAAIAILASSTVLPVPVRATTWLVRLDGSGDFTRIMDAVAVAQPGDTVRVGPGRYTWTNQGPGDGPEVDGPHGMVVLWVQRPNGVIYESEAGAEQTILDAEGQNRVVFANGDNDANNLVVFTLRGFTITGGMAPKAPRNPTLPRQGGGMALHLVYPLIENCIFLDNEGEEGGGVWAGGVSSIEFRNCEFRNNRAPVGAGMVLVNSHEHTRVVDCLFVGNHAQRIDGSGGAGGGLLAFNYNFTVERCTFYDNTADVAGSAFYGVNGKPGVLRYNTFRNNNNPAGAPTVALRWSQSQTATSDFVIDNNLVAYNSPGSAVDVDPFVDVTFACNDLFGNSGGDWTGDIAFWLGIAGNISQDPLFCGSDGETWTVERSSPLLAGNNSCSDMIGMSLNGGPACGGLGVGDEDGFDEDLAEPEADPQRLVVHAVAPNPMVASAGAGAVVTYELPRDSRVELAVFDVAGRRVSLLQAGAQPAGRHEIQWSGADAQGRPVAAGVYLVQVRTEQRTAARRVVVLD